MSDVQAAILQLQSDWFDFHDLDRARAVAALRRAGISIRKIASGLHFSESLLRRLLWTMKATPEDQTLARQNQISITAQRAREDAARSAAEAICNWLVTIKFPGSICEMIVEEVRREFAERERNGTLPAHPLRPLPPLPELIARSKPTTPHPGSADSVSWYAEWLCRWTFFAFPDPCVRDSAPSKSQL